MEQVIRSQIVDIAEYEKIRPEFRSQVLAEKEKRRVNVGPVFTFLFENTLTVLYQVQEMMRVERIVNEDAILHEMSTYNELIPPEGSLGATLLIEYTDPGERAMALARLVGIEHHVSLHVGGLPPVRARFDTRQMNEHKISSVQYMIFPLEESHRREWHAPAAQQNIRLVADHPEYSHQTLLPHDTAAALALDLGL